MAFHILRGAGRAPREITGRAIGFLQQERLRGRAAAGKRALLPLAVPQSRAPLVRHRPPRAPGRAVDGTGRAGE